MKSVVLFVLLLTLSPSSLLLAENNEMGWTELNSMVTKLYQNQKFHEAIPLAQKALEIALQHGPDNTDITIATNNLAQLYTHVGKFEEALSMHKYSLELKKKFYGPDSPELAITYSNLGMAYYFIKQLEQSEDHFQKAIAIQRMTFGERSPEVAPYIKRLADFYKKIGNDMKATALIR